MCIRDSCRAMYELRNLGGENWYKKTGTYVRPPCTAVQYILGYSKGNQNSSAWNHIFSFQLRGPPRRRARKLLPLCQTQVVSSLPLNRLERLKWNNNLWYPPKKMLLIGLSKSNRVQAFPPCLKILEEEEVFKQ